MPAAEAASSVVEPLAQPEPIAEAPAAAETAAEPKADADDTNYSFLTFVINFLPAGMVGLVLAAIFCAAMSATSSGLNALASTSVVDILRRFVWRNADDHVYMRA